MGTFVFFYRWGRKKNTNVPISSFIVCLLAAVCGIAALGCESLERKFTRKSKRSADRVTPVINFQDYSQTMTPSERYRKHALMFDYWNSELLDALQAQSPNFKRYRKASAEALTELTTLQGLLTEDVAPRMSPLLQERQQIDRQFQAATFNPSQATAIRQTVERQTRDINRHFSWQDMSQHLKEPPAPAAAAATSESAPASTPHAVE